MRIGILQTGHAPDEVRDALGDYSDMFERLLGGRDFTFETFSVVDGVFPDGPHLADGWLITGSRHAVYEDHPWIPPLEDLIRRIAASGKPQEADYLTGLGAADRHLLWPPDHRAGAGRQGREVSRRLGSWPAGL